MGRVRAIAFAAAVAIAAMPAQSDVGGTIPPALQVLGSVTSAARPVANALVIALNLSSFDAIQTYTSPDGSFALPPLTTGIYKLIAVKAGFVPATMMVLPTRSDQRINLRLATEKQGRPRTASQEIWEIRGSLPADVLRELDSVLEAPAQLAANYEMPRLRGGMMSMTGVGDQTAGAAFAKSALDVQSRIGDNWQIGIRGDVQRFDDPSDGSSFGDAAAESSAMSMELRSSPTDAYRVASSRTWWRYSRGEDEAIAKPAGLTSHNFEWEHGAARVKVRYFAHDNVTSALPYGSDIIEIAGGTTILQTRRSDLGVSLRVRQESVRSATTADPLRTADLSANGTIEIAPSVIVHYGMSSSLGLDRTEIAPSTGIEWKVARHTALVMTAAYKVLDNSAAASIIPSLVVWSDDGHVLPRYAYSFGFVSSRDERNRFSAIGTVSAADAPFRVFFSEANQQFWDGLSVDTGDIRRDLRLAYRHEFGSNFAIDVATTAGTATPRQYSGDVQKVYVTGDLQTIFTPTRTMLAVSYRELQQPQTGRRGDYRSERVNMRMAQSLYLPIDVKVLLGIELARAENSPFLLDIRVPDQATKKYIGGLSLNF